jgi:hypothetical protein
MAASAVVAKNLPQTEGFLTIALKRTQTIMEGAAYCDFRYTLKKES